jgi:hypothetical protein
LLATIFPKTKPSLVINRNNGDLSRDNFHISGKEHRFAAPNRWEFFQCLTMPKAMVGAKPRVTIKHQLLRRRLAISAALRLSPSNSNTMSASCLRVGQSAISDGRGAPSAEDAMTVRGFEAVKAIT